MKTIHLSSIALFAFLLAFNVSFGQNNAREDTTKVIVAPPPAEEIYDVVEEEARFPGGEEAMRKFIMDNIQYATLKGEEGKVYVRFVVEKDGSISNVEIARGASPSLDAEALRVVKMMPNWTPGKHRGKAMRTRVVVPIVFTL